MTLDQPPKEPTAGEPLVSRRPGALKFIMVYIGVVALVIALAVGGYLAATWQPGQGEPPVLPAVFEKARAMGVATTWDDYWQKLSVPDGENAADYYQAAILEMSEDPSAQYLSWKDTPPGLPLISRTSSEFPEPVEFPGPGEPVPKDLKARVGEYLAEIEDALDLVHRGAQCPYSEHHLEFAGINTSWSHLSFTRGLVRRVALAAWLEAVEGRPEKALEKVHDALALAGSLKREPFAISRRVEAACYGIATQNALQQVLQNCDPSGESLAALQRELLRHAEAIDIASVIDGEVMSARYDFEMVHAGDYKYARYALMKDQHEKLSRLQRWRLKRDIAAYTEKRVEASLAFLERVRHPTPDILTSPAPEDHADSIFPRLRPVSAYTSGYHKLLVKSESARAKLRAAAVAVAALRYRKAHGSWPESASQLQGTYLQTLPMDPYSQRQLELKTEGDTLSINGTNPDDTDGVPMTWFSLTLSEATGRSTNE